MKSYPIITPVIFSAIYTVTIFGAERTTLSCLHNLGAKIDKLTDKLQGNNFYKQIAHIKPNPKELDPSSYNGTQEGRPPFFLYESYVARFTRNLDTFTHIKSPKSIKISPYNDSSEESFIIQDNFTFSFSGSDKEYVFAEERTLSDMSTQTISANPIFPTTISKNNDRICTSANNDWIYALEDGRVNIYLCKDDYSSKNFFSRLPTTEVTAFYVSQDGKIITGGKDGIHKWEPREQGTKNLQTILEEAKKDTVSKK